MKAFKNGKLKAVTFSFDDGNLQDERLIKILNKYGLKCTFNLSAAKLNSDDFWEYKDCKVRHINYIGNEHMYDGHEVACHGYSHPHLENLTGDTLNNQIALDKKILGFLYGYEIKGMAYPFGSYNDEVIEKIKNSGIKYSRTVMSSFNFDLPEDPFRLNPTCKFDNEKTFDLINEFISLKPDKPVMLYIWGHSYEIVSEDDWKKFDEMCSLLSGKEDIWYATNIEIVEELA